ncbi:hypothetical protein V2J09_002982 [Rumex salicifolius]
MSSAPPPATNTTTPPAVPPPPPPVASAPPPSISISPPPPDLSPPPPASVSPPPSPSSTPTSPAPPSSTPLVSPPPPSTLSVSPPPPTPISSSTPSPPSNSSSSSLNYSAIIGISIAGVVILLVLGLLCFCCMKKKRNRRNDHGNEHYYIPPPAPRPKEQHWQQSNPPPAEHYAMAPNPSAQSSRPPPSQNRPPPPFINSGGGSASSNSASGMEFGFSKNAFTYDELERATQGFADGNLLGQGGFGYVHKGILPNGKEVAVKSLKEGSIQGDREFQAEVEIISRVHHKHLVSLVGYCISGSQRILVYEFVTNKTLEFHLHGRGQPPMNWPTRLKIALGSAKGLAYLHEDCHPKIIHRDIKAANILLDFKFEAKVADFGLAKVSSDLNTHISTRVMGTFGYLAPEYASSGKLTDKSDVFSYGVMLLELITGHRPVSKTAYTDDCLVDWARPLLTGAQEDNDYDSLVDPRLQKSFNENEMVRMVACAAACVRHSARRRPRMSQNKLVVAVGIEQIVRALEGNISLEDLNDGMMPGHSRVHGSYGSSDYDSREYKEANLKKFGQETATSQDQGSSEYGGTTSEYGLYPSGSSSEAQTGQPAADSPSTSPPADVFPPASSQPPPPDASEPPPADFEPSPATPSSTQTPPPPPISQKSTPNSSAKSSTPPPVLEWTSSSKSSNSPSSELSNVSMGVIAGAVVGAEAALTTRDLTTQTHHIQVHHKHLVTLVGYCITGSQRMLVYEFVANKTLEFHLYG